MIPILQQLIAYIRILLNAIMEQHKDGINFLETLEPIMMMLTEAILSCS